MAERRHGRVGRDVLGEVGGDFAFRWHCDPGSWVWVLCRVVWVCLGVGLSWEGWVDVDEGDGG